MRKRHRFNRRMTRIVLLISFLFFFGRFVYSSIGAWYHHQDKKASQESSLTVEPSAIIILEAPHSADRVARC
ncbi:TPA: YfgG family protein [Klebsiella variicola subsp. variicola]